MDVRALLDTTFPNRWMAQFAWPPRSPDVTPLDFFFWDYVRDIVYSREIRNVEDLCVSITATMATVTTKMLLRTCLELDYRLDILRATKGAHMEVH
ncbi:hypothetical protein AVEN_218351-1 [Araneus ventricosus]|uniref:Tc1-like transposase DDE domain-containing protein n=1 Tax=Araneus ventricosus TaxID=182803 RepID=A0A4Y2U408_ARAVE|nr:hypothetical protein AVEN_115572-1 [Araneus ventricosus]GBO06337.1 hypothetical protein AVEN_218351-1 [Araneus ventricosus]